MGRWSTDAGSFSWRRVLFGSRQEVEDALAACAAFNTTDRLADAFGFDLLRRSSAGLARL
jgi:hypothetical protein